MMMMNIIFVAVTIVWTSDVIIVHSFGQFKRKRLNKSLEKYAFLAEPHYFFLLCVLFRTFLGCNGAYAREDWVREREKNRHDWSAITPNISTHRLNSIIYFQRQGGVKIIWCICRLHHSFWFVRGICWSKSFRNEI